MVQPMTYQICTRCLMDSSASEIKFDKQGQCNYCTNYFSGLPANCKSGNEGKGYLYNIELGAKLHSMKHHSQYDCLIGLSGGVDSTYTAWVVKKLMGLNPLAVTLDNGWNTELAVSNIENLVKKLDIDLITHVINFDEMKSLELAYLRASVINLEAITDHAILALLWHTAAKHRIPYILTGGNYVTEAILPYSWRFSNSDWANMADIHRQYSNNIPLATFPHISLWQLFYYQDIKHIKIDYPLNYLDYNKSAAKALISNQLGWRDYGSKHGESIITRFYQGYILPRKWHFDKRRAHLSTLICSNQMTREQALIELEQPPYDPLTMHQDLEYVSKKLSLTPSEFNQLLDLPNRRHEEFATDGHILKQIARIRQLKRRLFHE